MGMGKLDVHLSLSLPNLAIHLRVDRDHGFYPDEGSIRVSPLFAPC
jgi:hypothetical protein